MQTVLIADDEENIREGIKLIIDWEELGFEIAGTASNGEEALSSIKKLNPSLVVMDMQMPKIHGIDVIKKARADGYDGYFIILSGYSDFSYAQDAIKNRVTNYITKPVDEDELYDTVKKIKEEIDKNVREGRRSGQMRNKAKSVVTSELLLGTYFEKDEIGERILSDEKREELESMQLLSPLYQVVIHETYHSGKSGGQGKASSGISGKMLSQSNTLPGAGEKGLAQNTSLPGVGEKGLAQNISLLGASEKGLISYKLTDLLPTFLDENSYEILSLEGFDCILLKGKAAVSRFEDFIAHYEKSPIESDSPLDDIFIAIGASVDSPLEIEKSYETASRLAKRRFFCDEGEHFVRAQSEDESSKINTASDIKNESAKISSNSDGRITAVREAQVDKRKMQEQISGRILDAVIAGNRTAMINSSEELYDFIRNNISDNSDACLYVTEIMLGIKDRLSKQYPLLSDIFDTHAGIIEFIEGRFYLYEIMQYMMETLDKVLGKLHEHATSENIIDDIISYTDRNYAQPLTLEDLASRFGYNSGYLGRLFTRTTGTGYNYYLNECRIGKAKEFLAEGRYKVYEVAQLVGYNDVDYFSKKFRKHAGMTPAEFRRQNKEAK